MKKPATLLAGLVAGASLLLSAPAAMAHTVVDGHGHYRPHRHVVKPRHVAPVRHDYRHRQHVMPARPMRDRDGDGVPNRYDARPDNPRRY